MTFYRYVRFEIRYSCQTCSFPETVESCLFLCFFLIQKQITPYIINKIKVKKKKSYSQVNRVCRVKNKIYPKKSNTS